MFIYYIYVCDIFYFYIIDKLLDKLNAIVLQNTAIIILNYLCIESYIYNEYDYRKLTKYDFKKNNLHRLPILSIILSKLLKW